MNPGLYLLASLDGSPLDPKDLAVLGLQEGSPSLVTAKGIALRAEDIPGTGDSFSVHQSEHLLAAFSGYLDEPEELAATLGLQPALPPVQLALAAVERFGTDAPLHLLGEWTFLRWSTQARSLTVVTSEACRDPVFFATGGARLALSSEMLRLTRLSWLGREIDPLGLALRLSRAGLRHILRGETMWRGVLRIPPETTEVFSEHSHTSTTAAPMPAPEPWPGSFEDAVAAIDALGRRIMRQQLTRDRRTALMLSGGLDSTLLALWAAQEQGPGRKVFCLTSVAPPESGLYDEWEFSSAVAAHFGFPITPVWPTPERDCYRPDEALFAFTQEPSLDVRHYMIATLFEHAVAGGARGVMNGGFGELHVTATHLPPPRSPWLLRTARNLKHWLRTRGAQEQWPQDAFHSRLSSQFYKLAPAAWEGTWRTGPPRRPAQATTALMGLHPAARKSAGGPTSTPFPARNVAPFRDRRFARLVAGMPQSFADHGGVTRALARETLKDRIPEIVRQRRRGAPFSPDYDLRMARQASAAEARIPLYRQADVDQWLDLTWLSRRLNQFSRTRPSKLPEDEFLVQLTACVAEFLAWAHSSR